MPTFTNQFPIPKNNCAEFAKADTFPGLERNQRPADMGIRTGQKAEMDRAQNRTGFYTGTLPPQARKIRQNQRTTNETSPLLPQVKKIPNSLRGVGYFDTGAATPFFTRQKRKS